MKKIVFIIALFAVGLAAQSAFGQSEKLSDKEKLIKASQFLEEKPLDKNAKDIRSWAFAWAAETKDVTVIICGVGGPFMDKKVKFGFELMSQYAIAMTAFKLQYPDRATDENAAQLAGVESALKVYEILLKDNPKGKNDKIDELVTKRNSGELAKYVADIDCGKK